MLRSWPFCQGSEVSALENTKKPLARQLLMFGYPSIVVSPPNLKIWFPLTQVRLVFAVDFSSYKRVLNAPPTPFTLANSAEAPHGVAELTHPHPPVGDVVGLPRLKMLGKRVSSKYPCRPSEFSSYDFGMVGSNWCR